MDAVVSYQDWRRWRACDRKRAWLSEALALNYAQLREWAGGHPGTAYQCEWCGDWHVTSAAPEQVEGVEGWQAAA